MAAHTRVSSPLVIEVTDSPFVAGSRDEYLSRVREAGLLPVAALSPAVTAKLLAIRNEDEYERAPSTTSAAAVLADATFLPRVVFIPEMRVRQWLLPFWKRYVKPESVID